MPAAAVIPAELGMGNSVAVKTFVVTVYFAPTSMDGIKNKNIHPRLN